MMCLPSISKMTDRRERDAERIRKSKLATCECCDKEYSTKLPGCYVEECWSPLIADKASSIVTICPECAEKNSDNYGQPYGADGEESGYFTCADCQKLSVYHYSWEVYATATDDGYICQECAGKRYLAEGSDKWLDENADINAFVQDDDALRDKVKHLTCIGGGKALPGGCVDFRESPEYAAEKLDWWNSMEFGGHGDTSRSRRELAENIKTVLKFYRRCVPFLAEAGQFQAFVSIAVHPRDRKDKKAVDKPRRRTKAEREGGAEKGSTLTTLSP